MASTSRCGYCLRSQDHCNSSQTESFRHANHPLDLWHADLCGPFATTSLGGRETRTRAWVGLHVKPYTIQWVLSLEMNLLQTSNQCLGTMSYRSLKMVIRYLAADMYSDLLAMHQNLLCSLHWCFITSFSHVRWFHDLGICQLCFVGPQTTWEYLFIIHTLRLNMEIWVEW